MVGYSSRINFKDAVVSTVWATGMLLVFVAIRYLQTNWWQPWRLQKLMKQQGIGGPPLGLLHGHHKQKASLEDASVGDMPSITHDIGARVMPFQSRWWQLCGKDFLYWWGNDPTLYVTEFETIKSILRTKFGFYEKPAVLQRMLKPLLGDGLLRVSGEEWVKQRKILNPVFRAEKLKGMVETMVACSACMLMKWEESIEGAGKESAEINVSYDLAVLAVDIISRTAFGSSYQKGGDIFACLMELAGLLVSRSGNYCWLFPTSLDKKIEEVKMRVDTCIEGIIQERHNVLHAGLGDSSYGDDLLGILMQSYNILALQSPKMAPDTLKSLIDQCKTFYFAGGDTISSAMQWALMLLALHPEWQEKARSEVDEVTKGNTLTADMLKKLKVVGMVISETLRLYPPAISLMRTAARDHDLGNLFIPKDLSTCISILQIHHSPELWGEDAFEFRPDRFSQHVPLGYMPFSLGPRNCIGQVFAVMEMKVALASILHRFVFRLSPSYRHAPKVLLVLKPHHGVPLIVSKRSL